MSDLLADAQANDAKDAGTSATIHRELVQAKAEIVLLEKQAAGQRAALFGAR
jgi:hypothetical protein